MRNLVIGNLKMNILSPEEGKEYLGKLKKELEGKKFSKTDIILCPTFVQLENFKKGKSKKVVLGAQDMFPEQKGSYTGETSPLMLKNFSCEYVILGHSERRRYQAETDEEINLKVISALKNNLSPILCVGETLGEREGGRIKEAITKQVKNGLQDVSRGKIEKVIIAYEPIWSVGTNQVPTTNEIMEVKVLIQKILVENFGSRWAQKVMVIYGGSVNTQTVSDLCLESGMQGALIGRESLIPKEFIRIAEKFENYSNSKK